MRARRGQQTWLLAPHTIRPNGPLPRFTHYEHGWLYGVWYCGTPYFPARVYGAYPGDFVKRVLTMFPAEGMLHLCCGEAWIQGAVNVDIRHTGAVDIQADAEALPFRDATFQSVLIDPPYSQEDATRYGRMRLIRYSKVMTEARRVLVPGGSLLWLDEKYPAYNSKAWGLYGLVAIVTGFQRRTRILAMLKTREGTDGRAGVGSNLPGR